MRTQQWAFVKTKTWKKCTIWIISTLSVNSVLTNCSNNEHQKLISENLIKDFWLDNYTSALLTAKKENKLLLLFFCSSQGISVACDTARLTFLNKSSKLYSLNDKFVLCFIQTCLDLDSPSLDYRFLSKLLTGSHDFKLPSPSFVIIDPEEQENRSHFIPASLRIEQILKISHSFWEERL